MTQVLILTGWLAITAPPDAFQAHIRTTDPLSAAAQRETFTLPPGFEIQLFAAEPNIQKPMNLAFDAGGRLWMSGSVEYPYAARDGEGRDTIKVLEDTDGDGSADKITTFVDGLNIPMGIYPYLDGVIAYSIPNIYFFRDTDGDGRADRRDILFGPLGEARDTHGMQNAFRRGFDGWLYINHGFANTSTVEARDGSRITLNSGNTYRVRLDGSRVEQFTWGQVNPFGSCWIDTGELITTDCHSKPLTLLLRDGYYSSFGKPHDGLGYAPELMQHHHGSTGLAGAAFSSEIGFPAPFQRNLFLGNVVTSRVHRDTIAYDGSSPRAVEQPDFLTTTDPWFRPVDVRFGPDGALYIADFYNRIIGHYEVPLDHEGRDRTRGRIWRVTYRGDNPAARKSAPLAQADVQQLVEALADPNLVRRMLAMDQLSDRIGASAIQPLRDALPSSQPMHRVHIAWSLLRLNVLRESDLYRLLNDENELVAIHALQMLAESTLSSPRIKSAFIDCLNKPSPRIQRAAASAAAQRVDLNTADTLLSQFQQASDTDPYLKHSLRIALRNQLRRPPNFESLLAADLSHEQRDVIIDIATSIRSEQAATFILDHLKDRSYLRVNQLSHVTRYLPVERCDEAVRLVRDATANDLGLQATFFDAIVTALRQRGSEPTASVTQWSKELAERLLESDSDDLAWNPAGKSNLWGLEARTDSGGNARPFLSSLPGGEQETGSLRSKVFKLPSILSFELCGHRGLPENAALDQNIVRLILEENGQVIRHAYPPRNDVARRVTWDLSDVAGKLARLEVVDGIDLKAFAWLAVADFEPPVVEIPREPPRSVADLKIAGAGLAKRIQHDPLITTLRDISLTHPSWSVRIAALDALVALRDSGTGSFLIPLLSEARIDQQLREDVAQSLVRHEPIEPLTERLFQSLQLRDQFALAEPMSGTERDAKLLVDLVEKGRASRQLLQRETLRDRLSSVADSTMRERIAALVEGLPPIDEQGQRTIDEQVTSLTKDQGSVPAGRLVFEKQCATCHQVGGRGALIGPQLDGIGNRGTVRIVEDVLMPHRNVDAAFQSSILVLDDGRVLSGLLRREEGETLVFANTEGKEFSVNKSQIEERKQAKTSIMPDNFAATLDQTARRDLFAFLTSLKQK